MRKEEGTKFPTIVNPIIKGANGRHGKAKIIEQEKELMNKAKGIYLTIIFF